MQIKAVCPLLFFALLPFVGVPAGTAAPLASSATATPAPVPTTAKNRAAFAPLESEIVASINEVRQKQGLGPLTLNPALTQAAQTQSDTLAETGQLDHTDPQGHSAGDRVHAAGYGEFVVLGENLAMNGGYEKPAAQAVIGWLKSTGHRGNILNSEFTETGVGVSEKDGLYYFTQVFARPVGVHAAESPLAPVVAGSTATAAIPAWLTRFVELLNIQRRAHGVAPIALNARLCDAAQQGSITLVKDTKQHPGTLTTLSVPLDHRLRDAGYKGGLRLKEMSLIGPESADAFLTGVMERGGAFRLYLLSPEITELGVGFLNENGGDGPINAWNVIFGARMQ